MDDRSKLKQILSIESTNNKAKSELIESLFSKLDAALKRQLEQQRELDHKDIVVRAVEDELKKIKSENEDLKRQMSSDPFVLVLIDGDLNKDQFVRNGRNGGEMVTKLLHAATHKYAQALPGFSPHWKFIVRVYTKLSGLTQSYIKAGIIPNEGTFLSFVEGFNAVYELSELIDAGNDKEGADNSIKGNLSLFYNNLHCQHIVLAIAGDDSYNPPLRKYASNDGKNERITLIRSLAFTGEQRRVAKNFHVTEFPGVFRNSKLVLAERTPPPYTSTTTGPTNTIATILQPQTDPKTCLRPQIAQFATHHVGKQPAPQAKQRPVILRFNQHGHRIDSVLQEYDSSLLKNLKKRKLCNRHFLSRCTSSPCNYSHNADLKEDEIETLRRISRLAPCSTLWCADPQCTLGHRCPHDGNCELQQKCKFSQVMHNVDTAVVRTVSVDI